MARRREATIAPATGPYCTMQDLLGLRAVAARLQLQPPSRALGELAGTLRSARRGRGIEFEEVRAYEPGDDVRTIDWNVTARTGRTHTRIFREERERPVFLLVDQRQRISYRNPVAQRLLGCEAGQTLEQALAWLDAFCSDRRWQVTAFALCSPGLAEKAATSPPAARGRTGSLI